MCVCALEEHSPDTKPERNQYQQGSSWQIRLSACDRRHWAQIYLEVLLHGYISDRHHKLLSRSTAHIAVHSYLINKTLFPEEKSPRAISNSPFLWQTSSQCQISSLIGYSWAYINTRAFTFSCCPRHKKQIPASSHQVKYLSNLHALTWLLWN